MFNYYRLILLIIGIVCGNAADYFTEKPSYIKSCKIYEPEFTKCSTESIQGLMMEVVKGRPELKELTGNLEPLKLENLDFHQDDGSATNLHAHLTDLLVTGFSNLVIKESKVSKKDFSWLTKVHLPKMKLEGQYKMDGRILLLNLQGEGHMFIELENVNILMRTKTKLIEKGGFTFYNITELHTDIEVGNLKTRFDNLFGGTNKEIEDSTNESFNKNWRDFFEALRPLITQTVDRVLYNMLYKIFLTVPANYFVEDIPTPAQLYAKKA